MRAKDQVLWAELTGQLRADEAGQKFLDFFDFWFDTADSLLVDKSATEPVDAMRMGLQVAEAQFGFLTTDWFGQMAAVALQHWEHGEKMAEGMTVIEHRCMEEALARKLGELQQAAQAPVPEPVGHNSKEPT